MKRDSKKITTVYISEALLERAKREGINISELLNNVLRELLEDSAELELMKLEEQIKQLRQQLLSLEFKRQQLLKRQAEHQKERNREALLYKLMNEHLRLKEATLKAGTQDEINKLEKEQTRIFNEILKIAGVQKGTPEFLTFSKLLNQGKVDEAISLAKALWKK